MSNAMKYIRDLEAVGFQRAQAEAQVQMVLDAIEGDLVTKGDLAAVKSDLNTNILSTRGDLKADVSELKAEIVAVRLQIKESEFRLVTVLGSLMVSSVSIGVAILVWLIKV